MTALTYIVTYPNGTVKEVKTYAEAQKAKAEGATYKAKYTPMGDKA
jgi:hypothetical protein